MQEVQARSSYGHFLLIVMALLLGRSNAPAQQARQPQPRVRQAPATWTLFTPANEALPRWIKFSGEWRLRWEDRTGYGFRRGNNDAFFLDRLRLAVNLLPLPNFEAYVEAQDSRPWGIAPGRVSASNKDLVDLRQFWIEARAGAEGWARLRVGRMELSYGAKRLIGNRGWSNAARTFDGARFALQEGGSRIDVFALAPVINRPDGFDNHRPGEHLRGAYGSLRFVPRTTLEPYFLWKTLPDVATVSGSILSTAMYTAGVRCAGTLPARFDYEVEMARQSGHTTTGTLGAWAGAWIAGYSPAGIPWNPRISGEYAYASGDQAPADGRNNTFDQLYPSTHNQHGLADQVGWRNIRHARTALEVKPHKKLAVDLAYNSFSLASRFDGLYSNDGNLAVTAVKGGARATHIGCELDLFATYNWNPVLTLGAGIGHLYPGRFLREYTPGGPVTYPYVFTEYRF